uniref:Uncharacterized protein n=2 Tax=Macaca TaxID=9539 RepID=A0A7N9CSV1_MACFA
VSSNQFLIILTQVKTLRISHCESTFTTLTGGPSGLVRYNNVFHNSNSHRAHTTGPLLPFHSHSSRLLLAEAESPPFFFHLDVTNLVVYVHQLSVYLYILSMYSFDV